MQLWFKPTLTKKFALLFAVTLLFWGGNALVVHSALSELSGFGETFNLAGFLRWRSQQIEVDLLRRHAGIAVDPAVLETRLEEMERAIHTLEQRRGNQTATDAGLHAAMPAELQAVRHAWASFRRDVELILAQAPLAADADLSRLHENSGRFLAVADTYVGYLANRSGEIQQVNRMTLFKLALADALVVIAAFLVMRIQIVRPLLDLARVTRDFSRGQFGRRSGYRAGDEIGLLAASFDHMADETEKHIRQIESDLASMRRGEIELRKFSEAIAQSPNVILITDANGTIEYANPRITTMIGYAPDEVIGKNPRMWKSDVTPLELHRELWETIRSGKVWRSELLNRRKNGELFWDSTSISPVCDENGNISHFVAVMEDISERKRTEQVLRLRERAIASSTNGIVISKASRDEDNPLIYANPGILSHDRLCRA